MLRQNSNLICTAVFAGVLASGCNLLFNFPFEIIRFLGQYSLVQILMQALNFKTTTKKFHLVKFCFKNRNYFPILYNSVVRSREQGK